MDYINVGASDVDVGAVMSSMTQWGGAVSGGEMDVMIADESTARRFGDAGQSYYKLSDLFTDEELAAISGEKVSIALMDEDGNLTGQYSEPCGIEITNSLLLSILGIDKPCIYVLSNAPNLDTAKQAVLFLAAD